MSFDLLPSFQNELTPTKIHVGWRQVVQGFVIPLVVIAFYKLADRFPELVWVEEVFELDHISHGPVVTLYLSGSGRPVASADGPVCRALAAFEAYFLDNRPVRWICNTHHCLKVTWVWLWF
ncbi:hypothetical protein D3C87_1785340 [compost metagenome]